MIASPTKTEDASTPASEESAVAASNFAGDHDRLVGVCLLLAVLVDRAEGLFGELADECRDVVDRVERLRTRCVTLSRRVDRLDARAVVVRELNTIILWASRHL